MKTHIRFRRIKCLWLFILLSVSNFALGQITFKLKSVVGNQNPSSNGLFAYGTLNSGNGFTQFPNYGPDGSGAGSPQWVWTYTLGQQVYPVLAFEHLDAYEITPQPFPVFGVFFHPANGLGTTVRLAVPSQMQILSITSKIQRATFGCGDNIGFQIKTASGTTIQSRVVVQTSNSPTTFNSNTATVNAGDFIYFTVDAGDDGSDWCDDTAVDVEVTLLPTKIVTPVLTGTLDCSTTSATFDVAFQQSGTLELYKLGNPSPISTAPIGQVGNTFNGQGTFTGLSLSNGQYYVIAKNSGQEQSAQSDLITLTTCCSNGEANPITVNNPSVCQGQIATLTANGCNGTVTWSNGVTGTSTTVASAGTYTATCTVQPTGSPCIAGTSTATGIVTINPKPTLNVTGTQCSPDLITYSVSFTSNANTITSTSGTVTSNTITNIWSGTDITITGTSTEGCKTLVNVIAPACVCPAVNAPITGGNKAICQGQTIPSLSVSVGTNETADWYDANNLLVASSTTTYTPTVAGIYNVQARNTVNSCVSSLRTAVSLTINALPTLTEGTKVCSADLLTYSVTVTSNGTITATAGTVSGTTVTGIPSGTSVTITATSAQGCESKINVAAPSCVCPAVTAPITGGNKTICQGQTIPSLSVNVGTGETVEWFSSSAGGTAIATGLSYTPTVAGTYYAETIQTVSGCRSSSRTGVSLTINALPTLTEGTKVCSADLLTYSVTVTSNGTITATAGTVSGTTVTGIPSGTSVTITATSAQSCESKINVAAPSCVCPAVTAPITGGNKTICQGQTIPSLSVNVGTGETVEWFSSSAGGTAIATGLSYTPTVAGTYYAETIQTVSGCRSSSRTGVSLTINVLPTLTEGTKVCSADLLSYSVTVTSNGTITATAGTVSGTTVTGIPSGTSVTITATSAQGCESKINVVAPSCVCPAVTAPITGGNKTICQGQTIPSLSVSVGTGETVEWFSSSAGGTAIATGLSYTPTVAGTYYAETIQTVSGCRSSSRTGVSLTINILGETPTISSSKNPLILGESATLTVSNCSGTVIWNTGENGASIVVTPNSKTTYSATCTPTTGCIGGIGQISIDVNVPTIQVKISAPSVCIGGSTTLSMVGCPTNNIYWTSPEHGRRDEPNPTYMGITSPGTFVGHCITTAGEATATTSVSIRQPQDFQITASKNPIYLGEPVVLTAQGCNGKVSWQNGQAQGNPITVYPNDQYTTYEAECLDAASCGGTGKIVIEVKPPIITASAKDVCYGSTTTVSAKGCPNGVYYWLVWHNDSFADARSIENPNAYPITQKTHFRAVCATQAGEAAGDVTVNAIPLPNVPAIGSEKTEYYLGETVTIGSGCDARTLWSTGATSTHITVKPTKAENVYTVRCINDATGCESSNSITIYMKTPSPKVKDVILCYNEVFTTISGCGNSSNARWTKNWLDIPNRVEVSEGYSEKLTETTTYAVVCHNAETGWSESKVITVTINPKIEAPVITAKDTIIVKGDSLTLTAQGCNHTEWLDGNGNIMPDTLNHITVKPTKTSIYKARCYVNGCYSEWSPFKVYVRPNMPVIITSADTLCLGSSTTITARICADGGTFHWADSTIKGLSFTITPKKDTTFKSYCVSVDSLVSDIKTTFIKVYPTPKKPTINGNLVIIEGERTTLTASGCEESLVWSTGATSASINVNPVKNTLYSVTCGVWQCVSDTAAVLVRVRPRPIEIETSGNGSRGFNLSDTLCLNKQLTLTAITNCNGKLIWNTGDEGSKITVTGTASKVYSVYCLNPDNEKSDISTANIVVIDYDVTNAIAYPNPTSGKLYIKSKGCIDGVKLMLYSQRGEVLYEGGGQERYLDSIVLDLYHLPSDTYILYIIGNDAQNKPTILKKRIVKVNAND